MDDEASASSPFFRFIDKTCLILDRAWTIIEAKRTGTGEEIFRKPLPLCVKKFQFQRWTTRPFICPYQPTLPCHRVRAFMTIHAISLISVQKTRLLYPPSPPSFPPFFPSVKEIRTRRWYALYQPALLMLTTCSYDKNDL